MFAFAYTGCFMKISLQSTKHSTTLPTLPTSTLPLVIPEQIWITQLNYRWLSYTGGTGWCACIHVNGFTEREKKKQKKTKKHTHTIHWITTMLATSKNIPFPGHDHLLITGTDNPSLTGTRVLIKVSGHQYQWLAGGYDLEIGHF